MFKKRVLSLILVITLLMSSAGTVLAAENGESQIIQDSQLLPGPEEEKPIETFSAVELAAIGDNPTEGMLESGNISWTLSSQGMLTLAGTGEMDDFSPGEAPWSAQKQYVRFIYISDGITSIGNNAFYDLSNARSLYIPDGVTSIGEGAFANCGELKEVSLPDGLLSIGNGAFEECVKLKDITIPESVTSIGTSCFAGCNKLKEINVESANVNYTDVDGVLFTKDMSTLLAYPGHNKNQNYDVPEGVTEIAEFAFDACYNLSEITLPDTLVKISNGAFNDCDSIESITIPASVTEIAQNAFLYGMESLEEINVEEGNEVYASVDGVLLNKDKTTLLRLPDAYYTQDGEYTIPLSVTTIGQEAFFDCQNIEKLYISNNVRKFEMAAFMYFDSLEYIRYYGTESEWELIEKDIFNEKLEEVEIEFSNGEFTVTYPMNVGQTEKLSDFAENFGSDNLSLTSSNPSVAVIEGETLVAIAEGESIISGTRVDDEGKLSSVHVKVVVSPQGTDNKYTTFTLEEGEAWNVLEHFDFSAQDKTKLKLVTWATTDKSVVDFDINKSKNQYIVNAVGAGTATVIATYYGSQKYRIRVDITVKPKYTPEEDFIFSNGTITKYIGSGEVVRIPDTIGGVTVTAIGDYAFYNCRHVTKVVLPDTVKSIGYDAFSYCRNLSNINLNEGLTTIKSYAFYYCTSLLKITIPSTVNTTSYSYWFTGCSKLDTVIYAEGTTKTGSILRGSNVRKVVLPSTLTEISYSAFASCYKLEKIDIPASVKTIATSAFDYCRGLREVNIANGSQLTSIGNYAFYDCSFASITLPEGLTRIDYSAFAYSELERIVIPGSVTYMGTGIFSGCYNLSDVSLGNGITSIPSNTFYDCNALTSIIIPDSVISIGSYAFYSSGLKNVILGSGLRTIGAYAFAYCYDLAEISIPDSVTSIGNDAFYNCTNLASIYFGTGLKTIGYEAFGYCQKLTSVDLPDGLTSLGSYAFRGCTRLSSIDLGNSLTSIPDYVFYGCYALTKITIPGSVRNLGANIFESCRSITEVTFGEGITSIPSYTFSGCYNLKKINLPNSVKTIGNRAFYNCYNLEQVNLGSALTSIGAYAFTYCSKLKSITIPDNVTYIGDSAFYYCTALSSVKLGSKLKTIDYYAFYRCTSLTSIVIPASVTYIGSYAFAYDSSLRNVTIGNGSAYIGYNAFYGCPWNPNAVLVSSSYTTEENTGMSYIPLKVTYEFKEGSTATNKVVKITLPIYAFVASGSMKLNGVACSYTETQDNEVNVDNPNKKKYITIPVDANVGELDFCIKSSEYKTISTTAEISFSTLTGTKTERIGSLNCTLPAISISAPDITGSANVVVEGLSIPYKTVTLYIDGVNKGTVYTSSTGAFKKTVTISHPENYRIYTIRAEVTNNGKVESAEADIQYVANTPTLTGLKLYYYGGSYYGYNGTRNESYDLYNATYRFIQWGYSGSYDHSAKYYNYYFTVDVSNRSQVDKVYVVSTRDGHKEYLEAKWDSKLQKYKTSGYFANDWSYIPNNITVEYTKVIDDVKLSLADMLKYMDFGSGDFSTSITDYTSASYSASVAVSPLLSSLFGDRIDIATEITDVDYSNVTDEQLYPETEDYHSFPVTQNGKNCVVSFDLTDSTSAVIYIHDKTANKQIAYTMTFTDVDSDGNETKLDIKNIFGKIDAYAGRFKNLFNLNIDTDAIIQGLSKSAIEESQLTELIKKAQNLDVKKNMFILTSMVLAVANMNNISAPTQIIDYIKALINADITFFGNLRLAITYRIGNEYKIRWKIDPSGYVYEGVTDNRLEGVTATLFCVENANIPKNSDGSYNFEAIDPSNITQWDAEEWDQINPLVTDANGAYRWDVPDDHHWQVKYELEGYEVAYSEWLPVPPVQENVNVGLVSNAVPTVEKVDINPEYAVVTFSKYMDPATITNVKIGELSYTLDYDKTKTDLEGNNFAKEFTFEFDEAVDVGNSYTVTVSGAKSYAGVAMEDYSSVATVSYENVFALTSATVSGKNISVQYANNTSEAKSFNAVCAVYDEDGLFVDMQVVKIESLAAAGTTEHEFTFDGAWTTYKIFTWDLGKILKPLMKSFAGKSSN